MHTNNHFSLAEELEQRLKALQSKNAVAVKHALEILSEAQQRTQRWSSPATTKWWESPSQVVICNEFLSHSELTQLQQHVLRNRVRFHAASIIARTHDQGMVNQTFRKSETLSDLGTLISLFEERIAYYLDFVCARLDLPEFAEPRFEVQITATRNGGFFKAHEDNSHPKNRTRRLTFVYYFFCGAFEWRGGELQLNHQTRLNIQPVQNRMIFFNPSMRHEVLPFISPTNDFEHARFTVNGWVHQDN